MNQQILFLPTNVKMLRERKHWSQEDLAEKLGITRSKLSLVESGKTKNPLLVDLVNISTVFGISVDNLLKKDLRKLGELRIRQLEAGNDIYTTGTQLRVFATTVDKANDDNVEMVPEKARAGYRSGYSDPEWIAELPRFSLPGLTKHRKHRIFPIMGDSMLPYPEDCFVVGQYVEDWTTLKNGTLCVLILKSGGTDFVFKQIENRIPEERKLIARSLNPVYQPYDIPVADVLEVWQYTLHIANTIAEPVTEAAPEQITRLLYDLKAEMAKLSTSMLRNAKS